jgi:hypothetical protein
MHRCHTSYKTKTNVACFAQNNKKSGGVTGLQENIPSTIKKKGQEIHIASTEQFTLTTTKQGIAGRGGGKWTQD